ncbi:MAG: translation elongation factor Ts [Candidatus Algichlamydia australiensis]|nr:translation elongation factor Ts [Chlamydiales bacterium]
MSTKVTPDQVKELRRRTSVGMGKCKQALEKAEGDIEKAIEILRKEGMASAVKKEGRETKEGVIAVFEDDQVLAFVEINAETDFVAKNDLFADFVKSVGIEVLAIKPKSAEEFLAAKSTQDSSLTLEEMRAQIIQRIGENIRIQRVELVEKKENHSYGHYSHMGGKIVCMAELKGASDEAALAREIAMHIAAESPEYLNHAAVPAEVIEKEKEIAMSQVPGNKPPEIAEKIVQGKIRSTIDAMCLVNQKYIKDPSQSVEKFVAAEAKKKGKTLELTSFLRWQLGM